MSFLSGWCPGWGGCVVPPGPAGLWGIAGGGLGGQAAFSFPHLPWNHLQKKNRENKWKCLQSTLSTVPLTLLMPNRHIRSRSSPGALGRRGGCADSIVPLPSGLFDLFLSYTQPCFLHPHSHANLAGACFLGGVHYLPPPRAVWGSAYLRSGRFQLGGRCWHPLPALPRAL